MSTQPPASAHLGEDDLILHYYGEMPADREAAAAGHLAACTSCRGEYTALQRVLGAIAEHAVSPNDLPPSFERTVWARLEPNLPRERRGWMSWLLTAPAPLGLAAAVAVLVIGAFFAGRALSPAPAAPAPRTAAQTADQIRERVFLSDVGSHLDRSEMVLVELVSSVGASEADAPDERARVEQLLADSRLYRQAAEATGNAAVGDLLDEIERVLTEVAATPERLSSHDLAEMRRHIEASDLLFKVRVISSEVRQRQKETVQRRPNQRS